MTQEAKKPEEGTVEGEGDPKGFPMEGAFKSEES
jgi:hypothetical protein